MRKIIAVDFDGTLCEAKWPEIGAPRKNIIAELIREQAAGAKLILWTCREGKQLEDAVTWCLDEGLKFDAVNDNLPEMTELYGNNCRKVNADEYWDDKSVLILGDDTGYFSITKAAPGIPSVKVKDRAVIPQRKKRKRWWQRWFDGLRRGGDPLSEKPRNQI